MNDRQARIVSILASVRPEHDFRGSEDYIADQLLDSFDVMTFVSEVEKSLGIVIDGVDIVPEHFRSLQTIETLLDRYGVGR